MADTGEKVDVPAQIAEHHTTPHVSMARHRTIRQLHAVCQREGAQRKYGGTLVHLGASHVRDPAIGVHILPGAVREFCKSVLRQGSPDKQRHRAHTNDVSVECPPKNHQLVQHVHHCRGVLLSPLLRLAVEESA